MKTVRARARPPNKAVSVRPAKRIRVQVNLIRASGKAAAGGSDIPDLSAIYLLAKS